MPYIHTQVRHQSKAQLEKLKDMAILLSIKLSSSITVDVSSSHYDMVNSGQKFSAKTLLPGDRQSLFFPALSDDK